jgi:osomolarity two-component system, response regulator SSK1
LLQPSSPLSPTTPLNGPWPGSHAATSQPAAESSLAAFARAVRTHGVGGHASDVSTHLNATRPASAPESLHTGGEGVNKGVEVGRSNGEKEYEEEFPQAPIFSRRVSAPLPSRIGHLRNPYTSPHGFGSSPTASSSQSSDGLLRPLPALRIGDSNGIGTTTDTSRQPHQQSKALQTLSYELADSLQSAIQTLLQLSPPQLLDNAKEQYSGCTVQMPTTSFSALFTAMKGLNYLSANFKALFDVEIQEDDKSITNVHQGGSDCSVSTPLPCSIEEIDRKPTPSSLRRPASTHSLPPLPMPRGILDNALSTLEDFDIGELLQSTADLLGGQAAQSGVELVLFHGDVGIKHVSVKGDGEGLGYAVSVVSIDGFSRRLSLVLTI